MEASADARLPLRFGSTKAASPDCAFLIEAGLPAPSRAAVVRFSLPETGRGRGWDTSLHPAGCACCLPAGEVAEALRRLFLGRARGAFPLFRAVVAVTRDARGQAAIRAALREDRLVSAWFRLEEEPADG
jgi:hypothetical protein